MNGAKIAALCASMTSLHDWMKENVYYFLGPHWLNRILATASAVAVGTSLSMPFDNLRVRLHTMRPLPTGEWPYRGYMHLMYCVSDLLSLLFRCCRTSATQSSSQTSSRSMRASTLTSRACSAFATWYGSAVLPSCLGAVHSGLLLQNAVPRGALAG